MGTELSDDAITIRRYRAGDVPLVYEAVRESLGELVTWMPWCHPDYSQQESASFISSQKEAWEQGTDYAFAIFDRAGGRFLGGVGLNQFNRNHRFANLGYRVRSSRTRRGIATAATLLAARLGFDDLKLHRIEIVVAVDDVASRRAVMYSLICS